MENSVDLAIIQGVLEILVFCVMVKVIVKLGVIDGVYIDMSMGAEKRFSEEGIVPLGISSMDGIEVF